MSIYSEQTQYLPSFKFTVSIEGIGNIGFSEVSGISIESDLIEMNECTSSVKSYILNNVEYGAVTLSKGIFISENSISRDVQQLLSWFIDSQVRHNIPVTGNKTKRNVEINRFSLSSEKPPLVILLEEAFPTKLDLSDLDAMSGSISVLSLELMPTRISIGESGNTVRLG